jgi:RNA-dependent RNA polymerase
MIKFRSSHDVFEVCKLSAPRRVYLNRQAILLLSYRKIPDACFLILQQRNYLSLIRCLLRNTDAEQLLRDRLPPWLLPIDFHLIKIDYIHEPFFRQILINACIKSVLELLRRTRISIPENHGRNMMGIIDEYNVLKENEVFLQYTVLNKLTFDKNREVEKPVIVKDKKVVITKNPCHHPGDIRTFIARDYPQLRHLQDVIVFSQQGERPATHDISGSDLDGDEYIVIWHDDLVPHETENAIPFDYDVKVPSNNSKLPITRDKINEKILEIAKFDCLGQLCNLHLAFADRYGIDCDTKPDHNVPSTIELAGAISLEVDSTSTGYHPLDSDMIQLMNRALGQERPDFTDNSSFRSYPSEYILG